MARFFEDVDMVKKGISTIKEATTTVSVLTQESIMATSTEKETQLSAEMNPSIKKANKDAQFTKKMLNALKEETTAMRIGVEKGEKGCSASDLRIRENLLSTLTRKFVEVMKEYQASQAKYKTEIMKKTKRQIQIVKPDATEEEMDVVIRSGGADKMIQEQILTGEANESLKFMYQNINDRYNEILAIEASVQELHQLFLDMALLVEQQGELLDSIEFQVKQTEEHIDNANIQMTGAIKHLRSVRKTQLYCCCALMIILGIVILVVIIMEGKNNGGSSTTTVVTPVPTHMPTTRPLSLEEEPGLGSMGMGDGVRRAMMMGTAPKRLREILS
jgi:t-SNARE complex subunit (syntaxin)